VALLPAFATDILQVGSEGLGALRGAPAAGAVIMALILAVRPMRTIPVTRLLWVVVGFGISMVGFGLSTNFWLSLFFLVLSGVFDSVSMVIRQTLMQLLTSDHMRGRVSSVNSMFIINQVERWVQMIVFANETQAATYFYKEWGPNGNGNYNYHAHNENIYFFTSSYETIDATFPSTGNRP